MSSFYYGPDAQGGDDGSATLSDVQLQARIEVLTKFVEALKEVHANKKSVINAIRIKVNAFEIEADALRSDPHDEGDRIKKLEADRASADDAAAEAHVMAGFLLSSIRKIKMLIKRQTELLDNRRETSMPN